MIGPNRMRRRSVKYVGRYFSLGGDIVHVRLLGPVDVVVNGEPRSVCGLRRKAVLATLALQAGDVVSTGGLVEAVWGGAPPSTALNVVQSHVSFLRGVLGSKAAILARAPGYLLALGADGTDVLMAERLLAEGTALADPVSSARRLMAALNLWRGQPLADLAGVAWLEDQADRLDLLKVQVQRALFEARLAAGEHAPLVPGLEQLAAEHPLDEQIRGQLIRALYRSGRQADALAAYRRLRCDLTVQLGIEPSQPLRDLEVAILRQDPVLEAPAPAPVLAVVTAPGPAQLPSASVAFAGRTAELARLDAIMSRACPAGQAGTAEMAIVAVSGTAGVGKTALALRWAHQVTARFPDGQLYVNLRGFDPDAAALSPEVALRGFLDALGVPAARIPEGLPAQAGLYRSLLAGKRVLVVLDNARDVEQVRPLLPGSAGCMAVVTSRNHLTALIAVEGAAPLTLDLLTTAEARDLLSSRLSPARVASAPAAVDEIIDRCARLPLALAIAAARAATHLEFPLAALAAELREAACALDPFDGGDLGTDARAVFSWSYRALSADAARLFRLLGRSPGPDITIAGAASLAAIPPERTGPLLAELARAHLLTEHLPRRYACHDLLRAYAAELAAACDSQADSDAAVRRLLEHYLHTAHAAAMLIQPTVVPITLDPPGPGVVLEPPGTVGAAQEWFTAELATLLTAVRLAAGILAADGSYAGGLAWRFAWTLTTFLLRRGLWNDQATAWTLALDAARRSGDLVGQANSLHGLAAGYARSGRLNQAYPLFKEALARFEAIGDYASQATVHNSLTVLAERRQRPADMLSHSLRAFELYRVAGHRPGQAWVLNNIGYSHAMLGNYQHGLSYCQRALAATRALGERNWEAATWHSLGHIHHMLGNYRQAGDSYRRSLDLCRELADRYNEADTLDRLGDLYRTTGDLVAARRTWEQALRIFGEIDHPEGERVRVKLRARDLDGTGLAAAGLAEAGLAAAGV
jgi:DNA-binding SARP family transcriptional activator/Tfp pilus assembly protein PilF